MTDNLFDDIKCDALRAWNRCAMIFNMMREPNSDKKIAEYVKNFAKHERLAISVMFERMRQHGYHTTKAEVMKKAQEDAEGSEV